MEYKSPLRKLVKFFKESRDNWKQKYQESRKEIKSLTNKLYYQRKKQETQAQHVHDLEIKIQGLEASLEEAKQQQQKDADLKKKHKSSLR